MKEIAIAKTEDEKINDEIYDCLNLDKPKSFFLYAGAGSGKTRTLVEVLKKFSENNLKRLQINNQQVAVITYTNAACDEIKSRLDYNPRFLVSTIHSFAWELIKPHQNNIREWLRNYLLEEMAELERKQSTGRSGSQAAKDRAEQIASKRKKYDFLDNIKNFSYNLSEDDSKTYSLNHTDIINIATSFLNRYSLLCKILIRKFPVLLIDESQDTKKELIEVFFKIQSEYHDYFTLGLLGDTMQRIYSEGKADLGRNIPLDWAKPVKIMNYRCPERIVTLINKIRDDVNKQTQKSAKTEKGNIRLFIVNTNNTINKSLIESDVSLKMAEITGDNAWKNLSLVKTLILEHHMAAKRGGFDNFFDPLYRIDKLKTSLLEGTLPEVSLFAALVIPLIKALQNNDQFSVCQIVKKSSPILEKSILKNDKKSLEEILKADDAVKGLYSLWDDEKDPLLRDILAKIYKTNLFIVSDTLKPIAMRLNKQSRSLYSNTDDNIDRDDLVDAWDKALTCSFNQFKEYVNYVSDQSRFGTHQGVKGRQFPRVMVIVDDEETRGFLFSHNKLFDSEGKTEMDKNNESDYKETSVDRTRRLFYVTCSRAEESLAVVAYTKNPETVKNYLISKGWFDKDEIIMDINIAV